MKRSPRQISAGFVFAVVLAACGSSNGGGVDAGTDGASVGMRDGAGADVFHGGFDAPLPHSDATSGDATTGHDSGAQGDAIGGDGAHDGTSSTDGHGSDATADGQAQQSDTGASAADAARDATEHDAAGHVDGATSDATATGDASQADAGADAGVDAGPPTFFSYCGGTSTTLTGTVYAPNGSDPIPNVRVYAAKAINQYPPGYCDKCSDPVDPAWVSTPTAANGTFSLNLNAIPESAAITFAIQIGHFRKWTTLPVTACQMTALPASATTLPGANATNANIPKIAVSSGNADHLDVILAALGITEYDCYEGRKGAPGTSTSTCNEAATSGTTIASVLNDSTTLDAYNMAFLSCAPGAYKSFTTGGANSSMSTNTASWVAAGGRLFATDTAYDYIAQAFPSYITWAGPDTTSPQTVDGANLGCSPPGTGVGNPDTQYSVTVDDSTLATWLQVVGFPQSPTVNVAGFYNFWSLINTLAPATEKIADGMVPVDLSGESNTCESTTTKDVPLTTQFQVPSCGRVIFSSYHTLSDVSTTNLTAQEKIMEYLIFDAATCGG